ncbi:methyl-accepting chemotaxis protein [Methylosinus sp. Ce-a6]|uniref:methyl-accepting chemotaxis protein n=1 Tax=Methylosinus sp. Ce-a6 TaxID=2172005 RepID=UPI00135AB5E4|nr:methyl-accepting chemotaxis protein [Methylosinus sp. Ce-a6]
MRIAPKILAPAIGLSLIMAMNVGLALWLAQDVAQANAQMAKAADEALEASEVRALSRAIQRDMVKLTADAWKESQHKLDASIETRARALLERAKKLANMVDPANTAMHRDFVALQETVVKEILAAKATVFAGDRGKATAEFVGRVEPAEKAASALTDAFLEETEKRIFALAAEVRRVQAYSQTALIGVSVVSLVLALGASLLIVFRGVAGPLLALATAMRRLAAGDFDLELPGLDRSDEIGEIATAVERFKAQAAEKARLEAEEMHRRQQADAETHAEIAANNARIAAEQAAVMKELGHALGRIAEKDLTYRIDESLPDAYSRLRDDFNSAIGQLEAAMTDVIGAVESIGATTHDIAAASDDLSRRTEQQAAALEETAASMEEIAQSVGRTAQGATHASDSVASVKTEVQASGAVVGMAIDAMSRIEKSSREIGQIINVIDEIAFQTNLLALNAGVEAARAGEAGKGFAVVAQEVRALAQRAAEAAKEIKGLISASSAEVGQGVDFVNRTGAVLEKIVGQVLAIDQIVADIASGANEQASSLNEISAAITQMDQMTQKNAAMVEETTAASHSLRHEAGALATSAGAFRISAALRRASDHARPTSVAPLAIVAGASRKRAVGDNGWAEF